jgi:hypothetical protein
LPMKILEQERLAASDHHSFDPFLGEKNSIGESALELLLVAILWPIERATSVINRLKTRNSSKTSNDYELE